MEVGIFVNGLSAMIKLLLDDAEQAATFSGHVAKGAPDGAAVSRDANMVTVVRMFEAETDAMGWAQEIRDGMEEGYLFDLEISGVSETPRP
jgi:hypothetical protein